MSEGIKHDEGKLRMDLLAPDALALMAEVLTEGVQKYDSYNWARGLRWSRVYSAALRHLNAWWGGEAADAETGLSHVAHAMCCLMFLSTYEARGLGEDDRYWKGSA